MPPTKKPASEEWLRGFHYAKKGKTPHRERLAKANRAAHNMAGLALASWVLLTLELQRREKPDDPQIARKMDNWINECKRYIEGVEKFSESAMRDRLSKAHPNIVNDRGILELLDRVFKRHLH